MSSLELRAITFKVPPKEYNLLRTYAQREQRTTTDILRELIRGLEPKLKEKP